MKLFLASYHFGGHEQQLRALTGFPARVAVIANACDELSADVRQHLVDAELRDLRQLGYQPFELDLRQHVLAQHSTITRALDGVRFVWARGGNCFVLRTQLALSGGDVVLPALIRGGGLVYGGYSAGACVAGPSLRGLETMDDPTIAARVCGMEPVWEGLNLIRRAIVPHVGSELDTAGAAGELVARYTAAGTAHWALRDDEAVLVNGPDTRLLA